MCSGVRASPCRALPTISCMPRIPVGLRDLQPGDLVFFQIAGDIQMHVGIYVGHGIFIHAPETGQPVSYAQLGNPYWKSRFVGGGRF